MSLEGDEEARKGHFTKFIMAIPREIITNCLPSPLLTLSLLDNLLRRRFLDNLSVSALLEAGSWILPWDGKRTLPWEHSLIWLAADDRVMTRQISNKHYLALPLSEFFSKSVIFLLCVHLSNCIFWPDEVKAWMCSKCEGTNKAELIRRNVQTCPHWSRECCRSVLPIF